MASYHSLPYECAQGHRSATVVKVGDSVPPEMKCDKYNCDLMAKIIRGDHRIVGQGMQLMFQPYAFAEHGFCSAGDRLAYCRDDINTIDFVPGQKNKGPREWNERKGGPHRTTFRRVY